MNGEVIAGRKASNFVKACLFADFGNGFGAVTDAAEWSFANLDITIQFLRMPVGEWFLLDAETHMAGNGHGTARNVFADEKASTRAVSRRSSSHPDTCPRKCLAWIADPKKRRTHRPDRAPSGRSVQTFRAE